MKRRRLLQIAMLSMILLSLLTVTAFATTQNFTVPSNRITTLRWSLTNGTTLQGSVTFNGTLWFYATNPHANKIFDQGFVSQSATFTLTANETGDYTLYFDNSGGSSSKAVTVSYSSATSSSFLSYVPLIVFAAASIALIIFVYWHHKKGKSKSGQS